MDPQGFIEELGLIGVLASTFLDGLNFPIPSEVLLPLIGALAAEGAYPIGLAIAFAWVGTLAGACAAYALGRFAAYPLYRWRRGKDTHRNRRVQPGWGRRSEWTLFAGRLLPGARTLISFPAGAARVHFTRYVVLSGLGFLPWVCALVFAGYYAEGYITRFSQQLGAYAVWFCAAFLGGHLAWRLVNAWRRRRAGGR